MKNILTIILFIFISQNILIFESINSNISLVYAMGNMGGNSGNGNNGGGNSGNNGGNNGQGGGNTNAGGNNPKAQANKNKNKSKSQRKAFKRERPDNSRIYRVLEFCKKNKEACGTNRKKIIRTDEEKRLIAIELIEAINRYRNQNNN